jgi:hypothetical protein
VHAAAGTSWPGALRRAGSAVPHHAQPRSSVARPSTPSCSMPASPYTSEPKSFRARRPTPSRRRPAARPSSSSSRAPRRRVAAPPVEYPGTLSLGTLDPVTPPVRAAAGAKPSGPVHFRPLVGLAEQLATTCCQRPWAKIWTTRSFILFLSFSRFLSLENSLQTRKFLVNEAIGFMVE